MDLLNQRAESSPYPRVMWLVIPLVVVWVCSTVYAFWHFQIRNIRPFDLQSQIEQPVFVAEQHSLNIQTILDNFTQADSKKESATVFNFWDPDCPCSRFNESHVNDIITTYMSQGIRFVLVPRYGDIRPKAELEQLARERFGLQLEIIYDYEQTFRQAVPSSPAVVVMDAQGQLAYFGPYSVGSFCGPSGGAFVEKTLDSLLQGINPGRMNTIAFGCFCDWSSNPA